MMIAWRIGRTCRMAMVVMVFAPLGAFAAISAIEAQNISDDAEQFAKELKTIKKCSSVIDIANPYREATLKHYLLKMGGEKHGVFRQSLERAKGLDIEITDRECARALFQAGKKHQSVGVDLAVKSADQKLIPRTLTDANQAVTFGGEVAENVSRALIQCVPDVSERLNLLKGFRFLVVNYMRGRFNLSPGFERDIVFTSGLVDLFGYESEPSPTAGAPSKGLCANHMYEAGLTVRLVEQLAELKPTATGVWLDRRLRGVK